jgi:hypothetical protein
MTFLPTFGPPDRPTARPPDRPCAVSPRFAGAECTLWLMTQILPWYSIRQRDPNIYHDNDLCPAGKAIPSKYRKRGHRCRMRCPVCAKLRAPEATARRLALLQPL